TAAPRTPPSVVARALGRGKAAREAPTVVVTSASESGRAYTPTREQRYRELLALGNSPQEAAVKTAAETQAAAKRVAPAAPKPQPQVSALSRLLQPIVNAVTGQKGSSQPPSGQHTTTPPNSDTPKKVEDPKDPNSDTTPPQLLGIEFQDRKSVV